MSPLVHKKSNCVCSIDFLKRFSFKGVTDSSAVRFEASEQAVFGSIPGKAFQDLDTSVNDGAENNSHYKQGSLSLLARKLRSEQTDCTHKMVREIRV